MAEGRESCLAASYAWEKHITGWSAPHLYACICELQLLMSLITCIKGGMLPGSAGVV